MPLSFTTVLQMILVIAQALAQLAPYLPPRGKLAALAIGGAIQTGVHVYSGRRDQGGNLLPRRTNPRGMTAGGLSAGSVTSFTYTAK